MKNFIIIILSMVNIFSIALSYGLYTRPPSIEVRQETDTIYIKGDSILHTEIINKVIRLPSDTIWKTDTLYIERVIEDYFTEKEFETKYNTDKFNLNITSYVYMNNLDSVKVYGQYYKEKEYISVPVYKKKRINYGIGIGLGYGLLHNQFDTYIGGNIIYSF